MEVNKFIEQLKNIGLDSFFGVPDSLMSDLSKYLEFENDEEIKHVITQNEGSAIGMAIGNFLSTKKPSAVYLQNSGLGNIVNPLTSLASEKVFSIPVLLIIGWRGEPDNKDEPQHDFQGEITLEQLKLLKILGYDLELINLVDKKNIDNKTHYISKSSTKKIVPNFLIEKNQNPEDIKSLLSVYDNTWVWRK